MMNDDKPKRKDASHAVFYKTVTLYFPVLHLAVESTYSHNSTSHEVQNPHPKFIHKYIYWLHRRVVTRAIKLSAVVRDIVCVRRTKVTL
jgi:hypothetical protein